MYRKLEIPKKTLITVDEVVALTPMELDAPVKALQSAIQIAEERIKSEICTDLFNDIKSRKNVVVTTVNEAYLETLTGFSLVEGDIINAFEFIDNAYYEDLWNEHLWKLLAEMVMYVASPSNFSRFTSQGELDMKPKIFGSDSQGAASVDLATMKWKMDRMFLDRISPLIAGMNEYLFNNRIYFPKLNCKSWDYTNTPKGVALNRKTAWIFGVYNDTPINTCLKEDRML